MSDLDKLKEEWRKVFDICAANPSESSLQLAKLARCVLNDIDSAAEIGARCVRDSVEKACGVTKDDPPLLVSVAAARTAYDTLVKKT